MSGFVRRGPAGPHEYLEYVGPWKKALRMLREGATGIERYEMSVNESHACAARVRKEIAQEQRENIIETAKRLFNSGLLDIDLLFPGPTAWEDLADPDRYLIIGKLQSTLGADPEAVPDKYRGEDDG